MNQSNSVFIINKSRHIEVISLMCGKEEGAQIRLMPGEYTKFINPNLTSLKRTLLIAEIDSNPGDSTKLERVIPSIGEDTSSEAAPFAEPREDIHKIKKAQKVALIYPFGTAKGILSDIPVDKARYTPFEKTVTRYNTSPWKIRKHLAHE